MLTEDQSARTVDVTVLRYRPEVDAGPEYATYAIPYAQQMKVLDALRQIHAREDGTLAFRWACGIAKCGTCTVNLDGRPVLSCQHPLPPDGAVVEPLPRHPVQVDLIVDRERTVPPPAGRLGDARRAQNGAPNRAPHVQQNRGRSIKGGI